MSQYIPAWLPKPVTMECECVCGGRSLPKPVGFRMVCDLPRTVESYFKCLYFSLKRRCCLETRIQPCQTFLLTSILERTQKTKKINLQTQMSHDVSLRSNQINQHLPLGFPPLATWKVKPGQSLPVQKIQVLGSAQVVKYRRFLDVFRAEDQDSP